jgi:hypothetical protein
MRGDCIRVTGTLRRVSASGEALLALALLGAEYEHVSDRPSSRELKRTGGLRRRGWVLRMRVAAVVGADLAPELIGCKHEHC